MKIITREYSYGADARDAVSLLPMVCGRMGLVRLFMKGWVMRIAHLGFEREAYENEGDLDYLSDLEHGLGLDRALLEVK